MPRKVREAKQKLEEMKVLPRETHEETMFINMLDIIVNSPNSRDSQMARSMVRKSLRKIAVRNNRERVFVAALRILWHCEQMIRTEIPEDCETEMTIWYTRNMSHFEKVFWKMYKYMPGRYRRS